MVAYRRFIIYFLLWGGLICQFCFAQEKTPSALETFYHANFLYEQAQYDEAIKQYEALLDEGLVSANLYYNLGNCYFKKGDLGKAVLYYERARQLAPRDADLESNYAYARSLMETKVADAVPSWFTYAIKKLFGKFTIDGLTLFIFFLYIGITASIITGSCLNFIKPYARVAGIILALIFILAAFSLGERISCLYSDAIVIEEEQAKFEPFERATVHFMLSPGMKVKIQFLKDGWVKIRRSDGKVGWVSQASLEKI